MTTNLILTAIFISTPIKAAILLIIGFGVYIIANRIYHNSKGEDIDADPLRIMYDRWFDAHEQPSNITNENIIKKKPTFHTVNPTDKPTYEKWCQLLGVSRLAEKWTGNLYNSKNAHLVK
jgi:hypothetical protein